MEQKLTLADLASGLSRRASLPLRYSEDFVRSFFKAIEEGLMHDNIVKVKGFGTFKLVGVDARESINVNTGERFEIAGHTKVSFTPDPALRDAVNKPFLEFETVILNEGTDTALMESLDNEPAVAEEDTEAPEVQPEETTEETPEAEIVQEDTPQEEMIREESVEEPTESEQNEEAPAVAAPLVESVPAEDSAQSVTCQRSHCWTHGLLFLLTAVLCTVLGYALAEYWHPVSLPELRWECPKPDAPAQDVTVKQKATPAQQQPQQATPVDSSQVVTPAAKQPSEALAYPQVEGGEYWIVGVEGTEVMKPGRTLLNFSLKYYKSKDFVNYICTMNGIENPDIVSLNQELKIPKLQKK